MKLEVFRIWRNLFLCQFPFFYLLFSGLSQGCYCSSEKFQSVSPRVFHFVVVQFIIGLRMFSPGNDLKQLHSKKYSRYVSVWEHIILGKKQNDIETSSICQNLIFCRWFLCCCFFKKVHGCKNNLVGIFGDQDQEDFWSPGLEVQRSPEKSLSSALFTALLR